ncbi:hypothetical protein [Lusitaniella coriacea]
MGLASTDDKQQKSAELARSRQLSPILRKVNPLSRKVDGLIGGDSFCWG